MTGGSDEYDHIDFWILHRDGRCRCAGEGECEWCRMHCLACGALLINGDRDKHRCPVEAQNSELGPDGVWRPSKPLGKPIRPSKARLWFRRLLRRLGWRK